MLPAFVVVVLLAAPAPAPAVAEPAAKRLGFIEDDYKAALALARTGKVPLFIDAWALW